MTQQEIQERNEQIALMLGWKEEQKGSWFKVIEAAKYVVYSEHNNYPYKGLPFHRDWNYLMDAMDFVKSKFRTTYSAEEPKENEYLIDEWAFKIKKYYVRFIQWTENGWKMFDDKNRHLSILYIIGENCQSEKEAVFMVMSDIAKIYNEKKL
jgi:hypothetical protein